MSLEVPIEWRYLSNTALTLMFSLADVSKNSKPEMNHHRRVSDHRRTGVEDDAVCFFSYRGDE